MAEFKVDEKILNGVHNYSPVENYVKPDEAIQEKLEWFQDQKLALMVHMGLYCEIGTNASWGLSDHDSRWSRKDCDWAKDGDEYRDVYFHLNESFNPVRFNPDTWAELAAENGFKYLIFTTKHHDGFCLWDTKETNYKTTAPDCPYSKNKNADIVKNIFEAFRKKGLGIGAYFSKPDWHSEYFWTEGMQYSNPTWRMTSYHPQEYPELWEKFVQYTHNQMMEVITEYGDVDILWLDGGQVCPQGGLDLRMAELAKKARAKNPQLLLVDRTVGGEFENYVTPEQTVPDEPLGIPWESNISLGRSYHYDFSDQYKSVKEVLTLFIDVICKGGNLALNISPQPDGRLPRKAIEIMKGIGKFTNKYAEAIYKTRACAPYKVDNVAFTKNEENVFAFVLTDENTDYSKILIPYTKPVKQVELMNEAKQIEFQTCTGGIMAQGPFAEDETALVFKMWAE